MQPLPSHSPGMASVQRNVVIDFSTFSQETEKNTGALVQTIIEWVRQSPFPKSVHVYLPSDRTLTNARQVQSMFLSLGCTVTRRLPVYHS